MAETWWFPLSSFLFPEPHRYGGYTIIGGKSGELSAERGKQFRVRQIQMVCICQDRQPIGIVRHILMQLLREFLSVAVLVYNRRNDLRKQHVILIRAELLSIQIQPTEQVLFLRRELDKTMP